MTAAAQQLIRAFDALPDADQESVLRQLIGRRGDQLADGPGDEPHAVTEPSPELLAELRRRSEAYAANPSEVYTWDEVVAHARRQR